MTHYRSAFRTAHAPANDGRRPWVRQSIGMLAMDVSIHQSDISNLRSQISDPEPRASDRGFWSLCLAVVVILATVFANQPSLAQDTSAGEFLLVRRSMQVQPIRLTAIDDEFLIHLPRERDWEKVPIGDCIALLNPNTKPQPRYKGMLLLADGQRLPGEAAADPESGGAVDALPWTHPWLGRMDVPLKLIQTMLLTPDAMPPTPSQRDRDVILLTNGDRQEGLIMALGDSISLEADRGGRKQLIDIPLNLVAAVTMIAPKAQPTGRRIWFDEGTIIDVQSITVGDDGYVRLTGAWLPGGGGTQPTRVGLSQIAAVLLDPKGMIPLATLTPSRVEGPATRYVLSKPRLLDSAAPLNLSRLEYRGPLVVRYALPAGCQRFSAEAELPPVSRQWGDLELVIRSDDDEVFRGRLNAASPTATINVPVTGRELTIELLLGAYGPIQDQVILQRAMLMMKR